MTQFLAQDSCNLSSTAASPGETVTATALYTNTLGSTVTASIEAMLMDSNGTAVESTMTAERTEVPGNSELEVTAEFSMPSNGSYTVKMHVVEEWAGDSSTVILESFEHSPSSYWRGDSTVQGVSVPDAPHGSQVAELSSDQFNWMDPVSDTVAGPWFGPNDTMRAFVRTNGTMRPSVVFGVPDIWTEGNKWLELNLAYWGDYIELEARDGGFESLGSSDMQLNPDVWYTVDIERSSGSVTCSVTAPDGSGTSVTGNDPFPEFVGYGMKLSGSDGGAAQFDHFHLP